MKNYLCFLVLIVFYCAGNAQEAFTTIWTLPGGQTTLQFYCERADTVHYEWETIPEAEAGEGFFLPGDDLVTVPNLPPNSTIRLKIGPENLKRFYNQNVSTAPHVLNLMDVEKWGDVRWSTMLHCFRGCRNMNITATDIPDLSQVSDMTGMFYLCAELNGPVNINDWDVSNVENMRELFFGCHNFNQEISSWDVSNVTSMQSMFMACHKFNQEISSWDVSNVELMSEMFAAARVFNQDLSSWNVTNVKSVNRMFISTHEFNNKLPDWNFDNIIFLSEMFRGAWAFNQDISSWDISNIRSLSGMFQDSWEFNQDLSSWDVSNVHDFRYMFQNSRAFNQSLGNWDLSKASTMHHMLDNSIIDCYNYSETLKGWSQNSKTPNNQTLGAEGRLYSTSAVEARNALLAKGWTIVGDSPADGQCYPASIDNYSPADISVWPNPFSDRICIDINDDLKFNYRLINTNGVQLANGFNLFNGYCIEAGSLMPGLYILHVYNAQGNHYLPVIKH